MRVLYVNPLNYGDNPAIDAIAHCVSNRLTDAGIEMRTIYADLKDSDWRGQQGEAVRAGIDAGVDGIVLYALDASNPAEAVGEARAAGIPVFSIERPHFPVTASIAYPNFNQGVYMAEHLATLVPKGARVGVIGGPPVVDDIELLMGIVHGLRQSGLEVVNDPDDPRYKNATDNVAGGYEKVKNLLSDFSELDALVPFNDETLVGALDALRESSRLGSMKTVSRNGTPKGVQAVLDGVHDGTWDLMCPEIGTLVGDFVVRVLKEGEAIDNLCVLSPLGEMITPERAKEWVPWKDRYPHDPLPVGLD